MCHSKPVRGNFWRYVDYDGDGKLDIIVGADDWSDYGWDNAYDASGPLDSWPVAAGSSTCSAISAPMRREVRQAGEGDGGRQAGRGLSAGPRLISPTSAAMASWTWFAASFSMDSLGSRISARAGAPRYAPGRRLKTPVGRPLAMDLEMITPVAVDWNKDGHVDLICGDEDGRVAFLENTGTRDAGGAPLFLPPRYFQQEADDLKCGALATPVGVDWDGDGDIDILCGNSAGYILFFENLSGPGVERPKWAAPKYLEADGRVIRIMAGPNGASKGRCEAKWGYTTLSVADWDGDGLPDLIVNSIWGKVVWFEKHRHPQGPKTCRRAADRGRVGRPSARALAYGWLRPQGKELLTQVADHAGRRRLERRRADRSGDAGPRGLSGLL